MNIYTFTKVGTRVKMRANNSSLVSCSAEETRLVLNPSTGAISIRTDVITYTIQSTDKVIVDTTTYNPGEQSAETVYDALLTLFPEANSGSITAVQYRLSALNTAPAGATAIGTTGEIRITSGFIYVCIGTNQWVRSALATW